MSCLVLDANPLCDAVGLGLISHVEALIRATGEPARMARSVYSELTRSGMGTQLDAWQRTGLLKLEDYRKLPDGDDLFQERKLSKGKWKGLSRQDRATLVVARALCALALVTGEHLLTEAANGCGVLVMDLFDVIRWQVHQRAITLDEARRLCARWDNDRFAAARPQGYHGSYDAEASHRDTTEPLPLHGIVPDRGDAKPPAEAVKR